MTTPAAARLYEAEFMNEMVGRKEAIYNPLNKPINELPVIYGFNNGGSNEWYSGVLMAQDGTFLGAHICSSENYMWHDLGILEGTRPDRHEDFKKHYPEGYRMEFVKGNQVKSHIGLMEAYRLNQLQKPSNNTSGA